MQYMLPLCSLYLTLLKYFSSLCFQIQDTWRNTNWNHAASRGSSRLLSPSTMGRVGEGWEYLRTQVWTGGFYVSNVSYRALHVHNTGLLDFRKMQPFESSPMWLTSQKDTFPWQELGRAEERLIPTCLINLGYKPWPQWNLAICMTQPYSPNSGVQHRLHGDWGSKPSTIGALYLWVSYRILYVCSTHCGAECQEICSLVTRSNTAVQFMTQKIYMIET